MISRDVGLFGEVRLGSLLKSMPRRGVTDFLSSFTRWWLTVAKSLAAVTVTFSLSLSETLSGLFFDVFTERWTTSSRASTLTSFNVTTDEFDTGLITSGVAVVTVIRGTSLVTSGCLACELDGLTGRAGVLWTRIEESGPETWFPNASCKISCDALRGRISSSREGCAHAWWFPLWFRFLIKRSPTMVSSPDCFMLQ